MELMLRFCDSSVVAFAARHAVVLCVGLVVSGELRATVNAFHPALVLAPVRSLGDLEELPQLDTRFGQGLV